MTRTIYPAVLVILISIVYAPLLLHLGSFLYPRDGQATDLTITHWPAVAFNIRTMRQNGQVPLWRTTIASGGPWTANPQSWLFYPPTWLFFLLPINLTFNLLLLAHLILAALATYAFGRQALGLTSSGAILAGLAFALAPWLSAHLAAGHVNIALALAWLPIALIGSHRAATTGVFQGALLSGVAWVAALFNHPQIAAFTATLTIAWFLLAASTRDSAVSRKRLAALLLAMPAIALPLSAALLIPLAEALPYLSRSALTLEEAGAFSLPWTHLLTILIPTYGGEPEQVIYVGLPVAMLVASGFALKRDRAAWFLAITAALATIFVLGTNAALFRLLFRLVPGLSWLRVPPRAWLLVAFSLALLAGRGLDALAHPHLAASTRRRVALFSSAVLVIGLTLAGGSALLHKPIPPAVWAIATLVVLAVICLFLRARSRLRPGPFVAASLLLVVADLGLVRAAWTEMRSPVDAFSWGAEAAEYLAGLPGTFRVYSPTYSLPQHVAVDHGLYLADGVDPFQLAHYADFLAVAGGYEADGYSPTLPPRLDDADALPDAVQLGLLNVGYVASGFAIEAEGLALRTQVGETFIYENEQVLPRAFVVSREKPQIGEDIRLSYPIEAKPAQISAYTPNRITVQADTETPGLLVFSEVWYPGWQARVDGNDAPVWRVEGVLRGVYVRAGSHTVELRYRPWTVWAGLATSGLTGLLLLAYAAIRPWRQR